MKKVTSIMSAVAIIAGTLLSGGAAQGAVSQEVTGVSAYYRADLGYKVGWTVPSSRTGVVGYTVTANPGGKTCYIKGSGATECTFKSSALGYTGLYNFTVATNLFDGRTFVSGVSNTIGAKTIPSAPLLASATTASDTQVDVAWVPSSKDGGSPVIGYKVTYWESDGFGQPVGSTRVEVMSVDTHVSLVDLTPSTMYVINVATCNALGCYSYDHWLYSATTPDTDAINNIQFPTLISGGNASTDCFDSILDGNTGEIVAGSECAGVVIDPSTYPVVDPTATDIDPVLATKFANRATLSLATSYSLRTYGPIGGVSWFAYFKSSSKSVTQGFTTETHLWSVNPTVCDVVDKKIVLKSVGTCKIYGYVDGDNTWRTSNTAYDTIKVTN